MKWFIGIILCLVTQIIIKVWLKIIFDVSIWNIWGFLFSALIGILVLISVVLDMGKGENK